MVDVKPSISLSILIEKSMLPNSASKREFWLLNYLRSAYKSIGLINSIREWYVHYWSHCQKGFRRMSSFFGSVDFEKIYFLNLEICISDNEEFTRK